MVEKAPTDKPSKHYTIKEFAERLNISEKQARRIVESGEVGHLRIGRLIRITDSQIIAYEASKVIEAVS